MALWTPTLSVGFSGFLWSSTKIDSGAVVFDDSEECWFWL